MGRHADRDLDPDLSQVPRSPDAGAPRQVVIAVLAVLAVTLGLAVVRPGLVPAGLPWPFRESCRQVWVEVVAAPEALPAVTQILDPLLGSDLGDGACLAAQLRGQEPVQTIASARVLPRDRWPDIWIPDSSMWAARAADLPVERGPAFASSPLTIASSPGTVADLGWSDRPPTWAQALGGVRPVAVPDLTSSAEGLAALIALRRSAGAGEAADRAVAAAALAAQRGGGMEVDEAIQALVNGEAKAPLVPTTEQQVFAANRGTRTSALVAVYPADGSPTLDYPIFTVGADTWDGPQRAAARTVLSALTGDRAQQVVRRQGFRDAAGRAPTGQHGVSGAAGPAAEPPSAEEIEAVLAQLGDLARPTRMLTLIDISTSMQTSIRGDQTAIELVREAARGALGLLPDKDAIGVWTFASELPGGRDWRVLADLDRLDSMHDGRTHRQLIAGHLDALPSSLRPGGTSVYDTTLAAVRHMRNTFDRRASNVVVLLTDGSNQDSTGITLDRLVAELEDRDATDTPVRIVAIGIGRDADMGSLERLARATPGGRAHRALDADAVRTVLFDALSSRA